MSVINDESWGARDVGVALYNLETMYWGAFLETMDDAGLRAYFEKSKGLRHYDYNRNKMRLKIQPPVWVHIR